MSDEDEIIIKIRNLKKTFPLEKKLFRKESNKIEVLKGIDLDVKKGEISGVVGFSGAGKSTLMNILGGVLPADSGEILLDGNPVIFHKPAESLSAGIAFIHQELGRNGVCRLQISQAFQINNCIFGSELIRKSILRNSTN